MFQFWGLGSVLNTVDKAYYRHEFKPNTLPVNLVFSILRSIVPQVYFRNPAVSIAPMLPGLEYELHARLVEDIDNWMLRELPIKYEIKKMITVDKVIAVEVDRLDEFAKTMRKQRYVLSCVIVDDAVHITVESYGHVRKVMAYLAKSDYHVYVVRLVEPTLEEAFLKIVGRHHV